MLGRLWHLIEDKLDNLCRLKILITLFDFRSFRRSDGCDKQYTIDVGQHGNSIMANQKRGQVYNRNLRLRAPFDLVQ